MARIQLPPEAPRRTPARHPVNPAPVQPPPREPVRTNDPHGSLRFWVEIDGIVIAGFKECSGLVIETEVLDYPEGGENTYTHKLPGRTKYSNITLKRGLDEGQDFYSWYNDSRLGNFKRKNVSILVFDPSHQLRYRWDLREAYPCKWTGPDLKADANDISVETVELAHSGLNVTSGHAKR